MDNLLLVVLRSIIVYLFIIVCIRLFGKKELAQLSIIDLVFILLISNSVQNAMVGPDTSLLGGLSAATGLFVANFILKKILFRSSKLSNFVEGNTLMLIYQGKVNSAHLASAGISSEELEAVVREHGVKDVQDVDLAVLERDGNISILSNNFQHKTTKKRNAHKVIAKTT